MSDKNFDSYSEELRPERSDYHIIEGGNLYLINFVVNQTALRPQHLPIIDRKVVPFLCNAVRKLGPAKYTLNVVGSASATGSSDHNSDLAGGRAYNAAMYAVKGFEAEQKKGDPLLAGSEIIPATQQLGDELAKKEAHLLKLQPGKVEKSQHHFRAAMFRFKAGLSHPGSAAVFDIREVYKFKFKAKEEPLPTVIARVKNLDQTYNIGKMALEWGLSKLLDNFLKIANAEVPLLGTAVSHTVKILIPASVEYCFELRDYRSTAARYRFQGIEHKDSWGLLDYIGFLSELKGVIGGVIKVASYGANAVKAAELAAKGVKAYQESTQKFDAILRRYAGDEVAHKIAVLVDLANPYSTRWDEMTIPASEWSKFMFHDKGPKHDVRKCGGPARRTSVDVGYKSAVDLDFAGYVPNNWRDYNAEAKIVSPFRWSNSLWGQAQAKGSMELVG